ncbi:MAG: alpha amylase C-terminal domain-containing protein, partial [Hasllibacter sp.]
VAEESTAFPGVSQPADSGGLGFGYKWNMGWMNDTLRFMQKAPEHRKWHHNLMTFGLHYAFSENFVLPISHDEVVHGKGSMLGKMPGDDWQRFANLRAYYGFMWGHPGKKLLFMGQEFAQPDEWSHDASLPWHLSTEGMHEGVREWVRDLNRTYAETPALHVFDAEPAGFEWVVGDDIANSTFVWLRRGHHDDAPVLVACNFTPVERANYRVGLPLAGRWAEVLNSDSERYGGSGKGNLGGVTAHEGGSHGQPCHADIVVPPLGTVMLRYEG